MKSKLAQPRLDLGNRFVGGGKAGVGCLRPVCHAAQFFEFFGTVGRRQAILNLRKQVVAVVFKGSAQIGKVLAESRRACILSVAAKRPVDDRLEAGRYVAAQLGGRIRTTRLWLLAAGYGKVQELAYLCDVVGAADIRRRRVSLQENSAAPTNHLEAIARLIPEHMTGIKPVMDNLLIVRGLNHVEQRIKDDQHFEVGQP